jgi:two-component system alkaline phosphatase synthesis response regulator PhoP
MKKILIVEDDMKIATALEIRLEAAGYDVIRAPDGFRGLQLAVREHPDLIIMDIWMPVGIGFSVAQRMQDLGLVHIPIIFITASKLEGLRETVEQLGAAAFFEKPYDPIELMAAISRTLEDKKTHPEQQMADR